MKFQNPRVLKWSCESDRDNLAAAERKVYVFQWINTAAVDLRREALTTEIGLVSSQEIG